MMARELNKPTNQNLFSKIGIDISAQPAKNDHVIELAKLGYAMGAGAARRGLRIRLNEIRSRSPSSTTKKAAGNYPNELVDFKNGLEVSATIQQIILGITKMSPSKTIDDNTRDKVAVMVNNSVEDGVINHARLAEDLSALLTSLPRPQQEGTDIDGLREVFIKRLKTAGTHNYSELTDRRFREVKATAAGQECKL